MYIAKWYNNYNKLVNTSILSHPFLGGGGDGDNI